MKRPVKRWLWGAGAAAGIAAVLSRWPAINDVKTGHTPEYPDLQPRRYATDPDRVFLASQEAGHGMPGWKIDETDTRARSFHAAASVGFTPFVDDVWVEVWPADEADGGGSLVNVRSKSRMGKGDLGVNARRIRAFLESLDDRLLSSAR